MEMAQEKEWAEAQKITVSVDLVEAAKNQLKFLAAVDRNRFLFEDQALERAIYRYNAFWLPLLAEHLETPLSEEPLVVPLDCEFIWHCHRLSPVRYMFDCKKLFDRILGYDHNVISSIQATSKSRTEEIWNKVYPEEPYELDLSIPFSKDVLQKGLENKKFTRYDLVDAVKRQIPFGFQVSRPYMSDDLFLREAETRYKGFLHLIRTNMKMRQKRFCVPTYDVDLMWHTHLLHPDLYFKDMYELVGFMVNHDDTKDETKEKKLNDGHDETTRQWEQTFGFSYWKAGAMSRGDAPTLVTKAPYEFNVEGKESKRTEKLGHPNQLQTVNVVEVLLEFFDIKNLPEKQKDNLIVAFSKNQPDKLLSTKKSLSISSVSKKKLVALFQCEPKGEFLFELMSYPLASDALEPKKSMELLGSCSISFEDLLSQSRLSVNKWVPVDLVSGLQNSEPVLLHVSISFTPPFNKEIIVTDGEGMMMKDRFSSIPCSIVCGFPGTKGDHSYKEIIVTDGEGMMTKDGGTSIPCTLCGFPGTKGKALLVHELKAGCMTPCVMFCKVCHSDVIEDASDVCEPGKAEVIEAATCWCDGW